MKDHKKMVFTELTTAITTTLSSGVCVKACPTSDAELVNGADCKDNSKVTCAGSHGYNSIDVMDYCIPKNVDSLTEAQQAGVKLVYEEFKKSGGGKIIMDLYYSSTAIYVSFGLSFVWSLIFIYLMSAFAETLAWCCVVLIQLGLIAFTVLSYFQF
jgi:hypothetical protein